MSRLVAIVAMIILLAGCSAAATPDPASSPPTISPPSAPASSTSAPPSTSPQPLPSTEPSSSPAAVVAAPEPIWSRVADQAVFADGSMFGVAAGPGGYVAVGCVSDTPNASQDASTGTAWSSSTGRSWSRATLPEADHLCLRGVAASPTGYVAWGDGRGGPPRASFWWSPDGRTWRPAPTIPSFAYELVEDVVWFRDRFVAFAGSNEPRVWSSPDGLTWSDVPRPAGCEAFNGPILVDGDRLLTVAVPGAEPYMLGRLVVAHSVDGVCWDPSGPLVAGSAGGEWATGGVVIDGAMVLVGSGLNPCEDAGCPPPPIAAWTSNDGSTFAPASFAPTPLLGYLGPVAALDGRLVAFGWTAVDGIVTPIAMTSAGGTTWREAVSAPDAMREGVEKNEGDCSGGPCIGYNTTVQGITAGPVAFVAVGRTRLASGVDRAVVWVADATTATPPVRIDAGVLAVTVTDDLRVRSAPRVADDSVKYEPLLPEGTLLDVLEGPLYGSGYWWYRVSPWKATGAHGEIRDPVLEGGITSGWVASADLDGMPWIAVYEDVDCGPVPCPSASG